MNSPTSIATQQYAPASSDNTPQLQHLPNPLASIDAPSPSKPRPTAALMHLPFEFSSSWQDHILPPEFLPDTGLTMAVV